MHVLIVCEYPTLCGGERSLLAVLPGLLRAGLRITVAAPDGDLYDALDELGVARVPWNPHDPSDPGVADKRERLAGLIGHCRPAIVHANSLAMGRICGPVAADHGIHSIAHLRDIVRLSAGAMADLNKNTLLLAVSQATRDFHVAQGLDPVTMHVLHNGVDTNRFRPHLPSGWLHAELRIPAGMPLLGTIGQIVQRKGLDVLARAAARVNSEFESAHWVIAGSRYSLKDEAEQYEVDVRRAFELAGKDRVHFVGYRHDIERLLPELRLLVHPSRQEPLGRVLLEAAACGVPCVATDVGGTREIFPSDLEAAVLVPPGDDIALSAAVLALLLDPARRHAIATRARSQIVEHFDCADSARELVRHYSKLVPAETHEIK